MRSQRVYQFLVVLLLMLPANVFSQQQIPRIGQNSPHTVSLLENFQVKKFQNSYTNYLFNSGASYRFTPSAFYATPGSAEIIRSGLILQNLPFFCKKEFQFEKTTSIPLRVRLGSLEYVNRLEGKE